MKSLAPQDWDKDKVWNNIESALRKKKRRGLLFLWFGLGTAAVMIMTVIFGLNQDEMVAPLNDHKISSNNDIKGTNQGAKDSAIFQQQNSLSIVDSGENTTVKILLSQEVKDTLFNSVAQRQNDIPILPPLKKDTKNHPTLKIATLEHTQKQTTLTKPNPPLIPTNLQPENKAISAPILPLPSNIHWQSTLKSTKRNERAHLLLSPLTRKLLMVPFPKTKLDSLGLIPPTTKPKVKPFALRLETGLAGGRVSYEGPDSWITAKEQSESFVSAATNTIAIDWHFAKKWFAFTGLTYQLNQKKYEYTSVQQTTAQVASDSAIIYQLAGQQNVHYEPGVLEASITTERKIIHNNFLHRWSAPLGIGRIQPIGQYHLEVRIGARLQLAQQFYGVILEETTLQPILDNQLSNRRYYQNKFNVGFTSSLLLHYSFRPSNSVFVGVQYEKDQVINFQSTPYQSKFELWGIQVGWKYRFF